MITEEDKERVRQATDFVGLVSETVQLRQRGREFWGCCPFHDERTPSFKVNPQTGLWHCFGCGEGGDVFSYVMRREGLEFNDAVRYLADRAGIEISDDAQSTGPKRSRIMEALAEAQSYYATMLMRGRGERCDAARAYLAGRGFGSDVCRRWGLGYAPGYGKLVAHLRQKGFTNAEMQAADLACVRNGKVSDRFYDRVMFPINDEMGRVIAFGGRVIEKHDGVAKYVNTRDTAAFNKGKHLYAYDRSKETMAATGKAIITEGYTDVIAMHEAGFTNTVAALGTAFRVDHLKLMERQHVSKIICLFDGDEAGQKAAERTIGLIDKTSAEFLCVLLPDDLDPQDYLLEHDASELGELIDNAQPLMDFVFERKLAKYDLSSPGGRVKALNDMASVLAPLKDSVLLDGYATRLANLLGMDVEQTKRAIKKASVPGDDESWRQGRGAGAGRAAGSGVRVGSGRVAGVGSVAAGAGSGGQPQWASTWELEQSQTDVPDDYLPAEALEDGAVSSNAWVPASSSGEGDALLALSSDDRTQLAAERELVAAMAADPDAFRPCAQLLSTISWVDSRDALMAFAILATPEGTTPEGAVAAASSAVREAPQLLSGGHASQEDEADYEQTLNLLLDTVELYSCRRKVRSIKARLSSDQGGGSEADDLLREGAALQRRVVELTDKLSGGSES